MAEYLTAVARLPGRKNPPPGLDELLEFPLGGPSAAWRTPPEESPMALRPDLAIGLPFRVLRALGSTEKTNYIPPLQSVGYKTPFVKPTRRK